MRGYRLLMWRMWLTHPRDRLRIARRRRRFQRAKR
jgi:hypothetical protein